jgi:D-alanyl-D-alanine carboxypeptidase
VITATGACIYGVHQRPVIRGNGLRRVAVTELAAALLAGAATPAEATADSSAAVSTAPAGQDRPELQQAMQAFVDAGFSGMQLRVHDEQSAWVGSAGVRQLGQAAKPPTNGRFWAGSVTKTFTATLVSQLVAEGKIPLDAPVADYLSTGWRCPSRRTSRSPTPRPTAPGSTASKASPPTCATSPSTVSTTPVTRSRAA